MLVGTKGGEIYEFIKKKPTLLMQGHFTGSLYGLAVHPTKPLFITCGGDKTIRMWDANSHKMLHHTEIMEHKVRAIDWSSNGNFIIAAMKNKIILFDQNLK